MPQIVLAIDQGTTGTTALLLDERLRVLARVTRDFTNYYPAPGHVEHDLNEIWASIQGSVLAALSKAGLQARDISAIGVTNQRETCALWDRKSGTPLHRALVWQDRRTTDRCVALRNAGHEADVRARTGLVLDPYFSGTKAAWLLDNVEGARDAAAAGRVAFGTIDTYVTWRLCGEHVTDPSNASRTLLFNLNTMTWDESLLSLFNVPANVLPRVGDSAEVYGKTKGLGWLPDGIPVAGLIGDQQGALFGQACFSPGMAKCTYGTGAFILLNTGDTPTPSASGMLTTVGWRIGGQTTYALEGSAFIAGAAVQFLRDGLGLVGSASEIEALAASVPDSLGVCFVPALTGLGAPHWRPEARGLISGLTRGVTRAHLARATLEGIALQIDDILRAMSGDLGSPLNELRVDGGASENGLLMQLQADLLAVRCVRPTVLETTAMGSGMLAGLATGLWGSLDEVAAAWAEGQSFEPAADPKAVLKLREAWAVAVAKA